MIIDEYLNQTVTWKSKDSVNEYNEPVYTKKDIRCRFIYERKLTRNSKGEEVVSSGRMFTAEPVRPDDLITYDNVDWPVITVSNEVDLDGNVVYYEVEM